MELRQAKEREISRENREKLHVLDYKGEHLHADLRSGHDFHGESRRKPANRGGISKEFQEFAQINHATVSFEGGLQRQHVSLLTKQEETRQLNHE